MTKEESLKHLTAMKICTECQISGKSTFCDDCELNYESGTLRDIAQALDIAIKSFGYSIGECKDYEEKQNERDNYI